MIKPERLVEFEDAARAFFRADLAVDEEQWEEGAWTAQVGALRVLLRAAYRAGVMDGLQGTGLRGQQVIALYEDLTALPPGYDEDEPAAGPAGS